SLLLRDRAADLGQRGACLGEHLAGGRARYLCLGGQRGDVDRGGLYGAKARAERVERGDFLGERSGIAAHAGGALRDAALPAFADLGQEHLPEEARGSAHARAPPAIAGMMEIFSPPLSSVLRPSRKRMSSSPTKMLTKRRTPLSSRSRSRTPG